jgi:hypothetical protein
MSEGVNGEASSSRLKGDRTAELPDVVYVEHLTSALYLDRREDVDQYLHVMESICVRAAPPGRTTEILHGILREE